MICIGFDLNNFNVFRYKVLILLKTKLNTYHTKQLKDKKSKKIGFIGEAAALQNSERLGVQITYFLLR